jgi:hypothetical protein
MVGWGKGMTRGCECEEGGGRVEQGGCIYILVSAGIASNRQAGRIMVTVLPNTWQYQFASISDWRLGDLSFSEGGRVTFFLFLSTVYLLWGCRIRWARRVGCRSMRFWTDWNFGRLMALLPVNWTVQNELPVSGTVEARGLGNRCTQTPWGLFCPRTTRGGSRLPRVDLNTHRVNSEAHFVIRIRSVQNKQDSHDRARLRTTTSARPLCFSVCTFSLCFSRIIAKFLTISGILIST